MLRAVNNPSVHLGALWKPLARAVCFLIFFLNAD